MRKQEEKMLEKGYATATMVAEKLGVHVSTVYRMIDENQVSGMRVGRARYVNIKSLIAHVGLDAARALGLVTDKKEVAGGSGG